MVSIIYAAVAIGLAFLLAGSIVDVGTRNVYTEQRVDVQPDPVPEPVAEVKTIVSYEFHTGFTNPDNTDMQKEGYFNTNLKNQYVKWTGTVEDVRVSSGDKVTLHVNHGDRYGGSATIRLNEYQYSNAASLHIGDEVTYIAKMIRWGSFLGFSGVDGVIV